VALTSADLPAEQLCMEVIVGIKPVANTVAAPTAKSLDDEGAAVLKQLRTTAPIKNILPRSPKNRVWPDAPSVQKPPKAPGKVETSYGKYKPGSKGGPGSFPAEVTTTLDGGTKSVVKGTPNSDGTLKDVNSALVSVRVLGGRGSIGLGTDGDQSRVLAGGLTLPVGRNWSLKANTSALNDGKKGAVTTGISLTAPTGASKVTADVKLVDAQEPGKSKNSYGLGVSVPSQQKDQAFEVGIGYENNPSKPRNDVYSAKLGYKFGSERRIDVEVTTGAENGTAVQGRINVAKF
jgi:hypothetical protein